LLHSAALIYVLHILTDAVLVLDIGFLRLFDSPVKAATDIFGPSAIRWNWRHSVFHIVYAWFHVFVLAFLWYLCHAFSACFAMHKYWKLWYWWTDWVWGVN